MALAFALFMAGLAMLFTDPGFEKRFLLTRGMSTSSEGMAWLVLAMALPAARTPRPPSAIATAVTGVISGYFSTTTSLNGPPVVLLLSRARLPPLGFIADLAGYFVITSLVSLALLWSGTEIDLPALLPMVVACTVVGVLANQLGIGIAMRLPTHVFRSAVISLVVIAGLVTFATA